MATTEVNKIRTHVEMPMRLVLTAFLLVAAGFGILGYLLWSQQKAVIESAATEMDARQSEHKELLDHLKRLLTERQQEHEQIIRHIEQSKK